jgi:uncharacterized RDD family membrane protein YckC
MTSTEAAGVASALAPAELDRRFYAYVVDRVIGWGLGAASGALLWLLLDEHRALVVAGAVVGTVVLVSLVLAVLQGTSGATPGKSALGIRAVDVETGSPPGVGATLTRSLLLGAAGLPTAGLGVAMLAWIAAMDRDNRRRGWHDQVTRSIVVDVRRADDADPHAEVEAPRAMVNLTALRLVPTPEAPAASTTAPMPADEPAAASPTPPDPGQTVARVVPTTRWRVMFDTGENFVVEGLALVGRGPHPRPGEAVRHVVPLRSTDMSLSKTHAQFHVARDGALVVMDRGSTNGSVLIRKGVSRELAVGKPATLVDGDRVRFGDREMHVARES